MYFVRYCLPYSKWESRGPSLFLGQDRAVLTSSGTENQLPKFFVWNYSQELERLVMAFHLRNLGMWLRAGRRGEACPAWLWEIRQAAQVDKLTRDGAQREREESQFLGNRNRRRQQRTEWYGVGSVLNLKSESWHFSPPLLPCTSITCRGSSQVSLFLPKHPLLSTLNAEVGFCHSSSQRPQHLWSSFRVRGLSWRKLPRSPLWGLTSHCSPRRPPHHTGFQALPGCSSAPNVVCLDYSFPNSLEMPGDSPHLTQVFAPRPSSQWGLPAPQLECPQAAQHPPECWFLLPHFPFPAIPQYHITCSLIMLVVCFVSSLLLPPLTRT